MEADQTDCYYITMEKLDLFLLSYDAIEGGDQIIDFKLFNPFNVLLKHTPDRKDAYYSYNASNPGDHKYCFGNQLTQKKLVFVPQLLKYNNMEDKKNDDSHQWVQQELDKMKEYISKIEGQIQSSIDRDGYHNRVAEVTSNKIQWWTYFQIISVIGICYWQITYLKSFFENRRVV
ncbi:hypothetical protein K502DRAFT_349815 [Neoconidiobolus thromboides FSU 785]|nr:hypothetical protein K502DRAFT_349815 [Neoconidiobolus thromboides FSU 785]